MRMPIVGPFPRFFEKPISGTGPSRGENRKKGLEGGGRCLERTSSIQSIRFLILHPLRTTRMPIVGPFPRFFEKPISGTGPSRGENRKVP